MPRFTMCKIVHREFGRQCGMYMVLQYKSCFQFRVGTIAGIRRARLYFAADLLILSGK